MKARLLLALLGCALIGCSSGEVTAKDMEESQKQIDADNARLGVQNPDKQ